MYFSERIRSRHPFVDCYYTLQISEGTENEFELVLQQNFLRCLTFRDNYVVPISNLSLPLQVKL